MTTLGEHNAKQCMALIAQLWPKTDGSAGWTPDLARQWWTAASKLPLEFGAACEALRATRVKIGDSPFPGQIFDEALKALMTAAYKPRQQSTPAPSPVPEWKRAGYANPADYSLDHEESLRNRYPMFGLRGDIISLERLRRAVADRKARDPGWAVPEHVRAHGMALRRSVATQQPLETVEG